MALSKEVHDFSRACEHLLSLSTHSPLSADECAMLAYYLDELSKLTVISAAPAFSQSLSDSDSIRRDRDAMQKVSHGNEEGIEGAFERSRKGQPEQALTWTARREGEETYLRELGSNLRTKFWYEDQ